MHVEKSVHPTGHAIYTLTSGEHEVVVSGFGAQILSWKKSGVPIIFENRGHAIVDGKTAYRGGAPICFPYFAKGSLLPLGTTLAPMHGHARTTIWEEVGDNPLLLRTVQPTPEGYGPTTFSCSLQYSLEDELVIMATIQNLGDAAAPFQLAVHTYWATTEPTKATATGLGNRYLDNLLGLTEHLDPDSSLAHPAPVDRVYLDAEPGHLLTTENYKLQISTEGGSGAVIWNPGLEHGLKDLGSPDFICLESGQIAPSRTLAPGEQHRIEIIYRATV
jgi:glucose-6-phosphate 1-epimerase